MAAAVTLTMGEAIIYGNGHYPNDGTQPLSMAAAVTLTLGAAIIYGSGHYPNDGSGRYLWHLLLASRNF